FIITLPLFFNMAAAQYGLDQDPGVPDSVTEHHLTANNITDKDWLSVVSIRNLPRLLSITSTF
ncbi:MAG: hypothetical protein PVJ68_09455, partial [Candidatus Thiodiazotropha sp.]